MPQANLPQEFYQTKIKPVLEYAAPIWSGLPQYLADEIENIQNRSINILGIPRDNLQTLQERREIITMKEFKRIQSDTTHQCNKFIPSSISHTYDLRKDSVLPQPISRTNRHQSSFIPRAISILKNHNNA